jgi:two-component system nitrogen regulation response regulator NtrX
MKASRILVVDDEKNIRRSVEMILSAAGHQVMEAASGHEAEQCLDRQNVDLILLDIVMPNMDGLEFLQRLRKRPARPVVVVISGNATLSNAVAATREGAYDFVEKPISKEKLLIAVKNALDQQRLSKEYERLRREVSGHFEMIGNSAALQRVKEHILRVAPTSTRVLILGESGTGKELAARAIHNASDRRDQPFIKVNCAAIPEELIESELFGHEKGSFTGAHQAHDGKFLQADGGTLFLDEIGDMSLRAQAKMLRVLQDGEFERVGGREPLRVNVRLITATNKDLEELVRAGKFREDLWFRLNVVPIVMPALRERREDIPPLVDYFVQQYCRENGFRAKSVAPAAMQKLIEHEWSGNVRELRNAMERLVIMTPGDVIEAADLPLKMQSPVSFSKSFPQGMTLQALRELIEKEYIIACLESTRGNITRAAKLLGIERSNLHKKMRALKISLPGSDPASA